ncbi:hypothetical protein [Paenibacillus sp. JDR-2]|uniref:hypothetical protein n=1 Tax=Paenibacillus sp. (strain JDR-2) TaxID=324057 RepID=UPI000166682A|nr:hypothetical protein [Paenibacillus sp. JDR-2]ACS99788.1 hypothetical protein Pjdr2_1109 [Paenibacillus sp. JDR-2]
MEQIYPLEEDIVSRYCGMPVYIIMKDGSRHIGMLSRCAGGKLTLNGDPNVSSAGEPEDVPAKSSKKNKKSSKSKLQPQAKSSKPEQPVQTQSYPFDPYYYEPRPYYPFRDLITLDFALIAFLFLLF